MNAQELIDVYSGQEFVGSIVQSLKTGPASKVYITGLKGSIRSLIGSALFQSYQTPQLYIFPDREAAEYFQNDLQTFLDKKHIWLFPSPFKDDQDVESVYNQSVLERTEILGQIRETDKRNPVIVTYPEALFEKVINKQSLQENTFDVTVGDKLDMDFMIDFLTQYNFERTDFVYEAGSFSIRGSIIDIFSFANELPYRIELFEDTVESIRMFDPETQLSAKKLSRFTIIPNVETQEKGFGSRISFFDYIPSDTVILAQDLHLTSEFIKSIYNKIKKTASEQKAEHEINIDSFEDAKAVLKHISKFACIEWGTKNYFEPTLESDLNISPQPDFNKNFNLFAGDLQANSRKGYDNIIFSDQPKQVERIYAIFEDLNTGAEFTPIYKILHEGFIDHQTKIACYTEHQIFGRYQRCGM